MISLRGMAWMYSLEIKPEADRVFFKLLKRNKKQMLIINKKISEIRKNPHHLYKHLTLLLENGGGTLAPSWN